MKFLQQSSTSERVTAALSTLFAIAILGVVVTAQQRDTPQFIKSSDPHLSQLEAELIEQLNIAYRHDTPLLEAKVAEFNGVLQAWQAAAPSDERDAKLAAWIRAAMHRSMPGRNQPLPAAPHFSPTVVETSPSTEEAVFSEPEVLSSAPSEKASQEWPASDIVDLEEFAPRRADVNAATAELAPTPVDWDRVETVDSDYEATGEHVTAREVPEGAAPEEAAFADAALVESPAESSAAARVEDSVVVAETLETSQSGAPVPEPKAPQAPVELKVDINVRELNARIAGYHEGLREVEAAIVNRGEDSSKGLEGIVETLEELSVESDFVSLYYQLLTDDQRRFVRAPRSMEPTIARVQRRLEEAAAPEQGDFLRPFDPSERAKLERLRTRLELLAMRK